MTGLSPSNLPMLIRSFKNIIQNDRPTDQTGKKSSLLSQRCTLIFINGSYLSVTEILKDGKIDYYHYDWYGKNNKVIMKFHSEPHADKKYRTSTEPYHIHTPDMLEEDKRLPNAEFQDLYQVLNFIYHFMLVVDNYIK